MGFNHTVNDYVAEYCRAAPDRLVAHGRRAPPLRGGRGGGGARAAADLGVRALKLHPCHMAVEPNAYLHGLDALRAIYEEAQRLRLPVMIHTGHLDLPGRAQPQRGSRSRWTTWPWTSPTSRSSSPTAAGRSGWSRPSSWCAASARCTWTCPASRPKAILRYFPRLAEIADKVLYGSDWPAPGVRSMGENLRDFRALGLPEPVLHKILEENPSRIFP